MKVGWLALEEVGSETLVSVEKNSVDVVVELSGDVLDQELDLVDEVSSSGTLSGGNLLGLLVVGLDALVDIAWLNLGNVEAGSESGSALWVVEQVVEASGWHVLVLLVNLSEDDWGHGDLGLEGGLLSLLLVSNLGDSRGELGRVDESHDVRVVLEDEDLLVLSGLIIGSRSNSNDGSLSDVWELELEGKNVEGLTRLVSDLELVGVVIEVEDLEDLSNNVEVRALLGSLLEWGDLAISENVGGGEESGGPLLESLLDGNILSLESGSLSREGVWGISVDSLTEWGMLVGGVESPGALVVHVDVELSSVVVLSHVGRVDSDDISKSVDDWEVLESVGIDDNGSVGTLLVESWVDNLEGADESVGVDLVWECGIDDDTIEVARLSLEMRGFAELNILVLLEHS